MKKIVMISLLVSLPLFSMERLKEMESDLQAEFSSASDASPKMKNSFGQGESSDAETSDQTGDRISNTEIGESILANLRHLCVVNKNNEELTALLQQLTEKVIERNLNDLEQQNNLIRGQTKLLKQVSELSEQVEKLKGGILMELVGPKAIKQAYVRGIVRPIVSGLLFFLTCELCKAYLPL